jgi:hypothetical protein
MIEIPPTFPSGTVAPTSGIYRVYHEKYHSVVVDAICVRGEIFPSCRECEGNVKFTLMQEYPRLSELSLLVSHPEAPTKS